MRLPTIKYTDASGKKKKKVLDQKGLLTNFSLRNAPKITS